MSKKYKEQMDTIIMSENMKKRILNNVLEIDKQKSKIVKKNKNIIYKRSMGLLAACCTILICINFNKLFSKIFKIENVNSKQIETSEDKNSSSNKNNKNDKKTTVENENKALNDKNEKEESKSSPNSNNDKSVSKSLEENSNSKSDVSDLPKIAISEHTDSLNKNIEESNSTNEEIPKSTITENSDTNASVSNEGISVTSFDEGLANDKLRSVPNDEVSNIKQVNTVEEAQNEVDFKFKWIQTLPDGYDINNINVVPQELVEIEYGNGENVINFKVQNETENLAEDYNTYPFEKNIDIDGEIIELKGYDDKLVNSASWNSENISYSISSSNGIEHDTLISIINSIS